MNLKLDVEGLDEVIARMRAFPRQLKRAIHTTLEAALLVVWENVPPYPPAPPDSPYVRTGTLGRSLGSGEGGGRSASQPDIYEIRTEGDFEVGEFGTRLEYAPYVIGDRDEDQIEPFRSYWWTLPQTVANAARAKVTKLFQDMAQELADWLSRKGG